MKTATLLGITYKLVLILLIPVLTVAVDFDRLEEQHDDPAPGEKPPPINCDIPQIDHGVVKFNNGTPATQKVPPGTKIVIVCTAGYQVKRGSNFSICLRRGRWLHKFGTCILTSCIVPYVENGLFITDEGDDAVGMVPSGTEILLTCKPGFSIVDGVSSSICVDGGTWIESFGKCQKPQSFSAEAKSLISDEVAASVISEIVDLIVNLPGNVTGAGAMASVGLTSPTDAPPTLAPTTPKPQPPQQEVASVLDRDILSSSELKQVPTTKAPVAVIVEVTTSPAPADITTQTTEAVTVTVTPIESSNSGSGCFLPMMLHGTFYDDDGVILSGERVPHSSKKVSLLCDLGFGVSDGLGTSYCSPDGKWQHRFGICTRVCGTLPMVENGAFSYTGGNSAGAERILNCFDGYSLIGPESIYCLGNGSWTHAGSCVKFCKRLPGIANGFVGIGENIVGARRQIACNPGYMLNSSVTTITCLENSRWTEPDEDVCVEIDVCGPRPKIGNGTYDMLVPKGSYWRLGEIHRIQCNDGYELIGSETVSCISLNDWTKPGLCLLPDCGAFPNIPNGTIRITGRNKHVIHKVSCHHAYELYGRDHVNCSMYTHEWTKPGICLLACVFAGPSWPRNSSLVGFWPLDDDHGLADVGPNGFALDDEKGHAIFSEDTPGPYSGQAYTVKGENGHIGMRQSLKKATSFTISFYFYTSGSEPWSPILMFFYDAPQFSLSYLAPSSLQVRIGDGSPSAKVIGTFPGVFIAEKWNFVALTYEAKAKTLLVYGKTGPVIEPTQVDDEWSQVTGWEWHHWLYVGKGPNNSTCCAGMKSSELVACLMIYDDALNENEILMMQQSCRCQRD